MKKSDIIIQKAVDWLGTKYYQDLFIPNTFIGRFEADIMRLNSSGYVTEYEIKISRADFKNDAKKGYKYFGREVTKYGKYEQGKSECNRFYYIVPKGLIAADDIPDFAGLIYFNEDDKYKPFEIIKNAPLMHKKKLFTTISDYFKLAIRCSHREMGWKGKLYSFKKKHKPKK